MQQSHLNKETIFNKISLEMNNGERVNLDKLGFDKSWIPVFDDLIKGIHCECSSVCDKMPLSIKANSSEKYVWDQKIGLCDEKLPINKKLRFRVMSWDRYGRVKKYYYSNEFTIKEKITEVDISDWQTYRNEEFGFEVKYPEEWTFRDQHRGTLLLKPTSDNLPHAHFSIDAIGHAVDSPSIKKEFEKIIFAGREAEEFNLIEKKFILREIRILEIDEKWTKDNNILYYVENDKKDLIPIFDQILSSFKFTEK